MTLQIRQDELDRLYTEDEFVARCRDDVRAEFVDGKVLVMSPVSLRHDDISGFLRTLIRLYLRAKPVGQIRGGEVQVRLRPNLRRVPDLLYISTEHYDRRRPNHVEGAPDAVWEIVSAESLDRDWHDKYEDYRAAGIPEYWLIDPGNQAVRLYRLSAGAYELVSEEDGWLASSAIPGFRMRPDWLWQDPIPDELACLREAGVSLSEP